MTSYFQTSKLIFILTFRHYLPFLILLWSLYVCFQFLFVVTQKKSKICPRVRTFLHVAYPVGILDQLF
jgi:hypothetical protein